MDGARHSARSRRAPALHTAQTHTGTASAALNRASMNAHADSSSRQPRPAPTMDRTLLPTDLSGLRSRDAETAVVVAWGLDNFRSLGFPTNSTYVRLPQIVPELTARPLASLSCGAYYCLALVPGEGVYGWGAAAHGQLGDVGGAPAVGAPRLLPFTAKKLIVAVAAGRAHALALRYEGVVLAWGDNRRGQTARPASSDRRSAR